MNSKADSGPTAFDTAKLALAVAIVVAGIFGYYYYAALPAVVRVLIVLVSLGIAAVVALQSAQGQAFARFVQASRVELRKVVWPTREETVQMTVFVLIFAALMGTFFWFLDFLLLMFTRWIMSQGS
ncbi:MAG: preprotein translocase subunit SecE [Gammaproteobacteria bacterium]|nr:preprotein translocase subunit SecE [Gammaproteobacteria bacterium]